MRLLTLVYERAPWYRRVGPEVFTLVVGIAIGFGLGHL